MLAYFALLLLALTQGNAQNCTTTASIVCTSQATPNPSLPGDTFCMAGGWQADWGGVPGLGTCTGGSWVPVGGSPGIQHPCTCFYNATAAVSTALVNNNCGSINVAGNYGFLLVGQSYCGNAGFWHTCDQPGHVVATTTACNASQPTATTVFATTAPATTTSVPTTSPGSPLTASPAIDNCNSSSGLLNCLGTSLPVPQVNGQWYCVANLTAGNNQVWVCLSGTWAASAYQCNCPYLPPPYDPNDGRVPYGSCHVSLCNGTGADIAIGTSACAVGNVWQTCTSSGFVVSLSGSCSCAGSLTAILTTTAPPTTVPSTTVPSTAQPTTTVAATTTTTSLTSPPTTTHTTMVTTVPATTTSVPTASTTTPVLTTSTAGPTTTAFVPPSPLPTHIGGLCFSVATLTSPNSRICDYYDPLVCTNTTYYAYPGRSYYYFQPPTRTLESSGSNLTTYVCQGSLDVLCNGGCSVTLTPANAPISGTTNPCCPCYLSGYDGQAHDATECPFTQPSINPWTWFNPSCVSCMYPSYNATCYASNRCAATGGNYFCGGDGGYKNYTTSHGLAWWGGYGGGTDTVSAFQGCYCTTRQVNSVTQVFLAGSWIDLASATALPGYFCSGPSSSLEPPRYPNGVWGYQTSGFKRRSLYSRSLTTTTLDNQEMITITPAPLNTSLTININGMTNHYICTQSPCINFIDNTFYQNPGVIEVRIYIGAVQDDIEEFPIQSFLSCDIPRCVLCMNMWNNFSCFPWEFQAFIISTTIAACIMTIVVIWLVIKRVFCGNATFCKGGCKKVTNVWHTVKSKVSRKKGSRQTDDGMTGPDDLEEGSESTSGESSTSVKLAKMRKSKPSSVTAADRSIGASAFTFIFCLLALPLVFAQPCAHGITIPVSSTECDVAGTTETCQLEFDVLVGIPSTGLAACLTFQDSDGGVYGEMVVTYKRALAVAPLQQLYWTSYWEPRSYFRAQCSGQQMCGSCSQYNPLANPMACSANVPATQENCMIPLWMGAYQGVSRCSSSDGCDWNGCLSCNAQCTYGRAIIAPTGPYCSVSNVVSIYNRPQLQVNFTSSGRTIVVPVDVVSLTTAVGDNFTITIEGTLANNQQNFVRQTVLCTDGFNGIGYAATPQHPVAGGFGDIQANTQSQLGPGGNYIFADSIITANPAGRAINYVFEPQGYWQRDTFDQFPAQVGSINWAVNGNTLYGEEMAPGEVLFTLKTIVPLKVSRQVNLVIPQVDAYNITGCYLCAVGFTVFITARSKGSAGQAIVTSNDPLIIVATPSIILQTTNTDIMIKLVTSKSSVDFDLQVSAGKYTSIIHVTGDLVFQPLVGFHNGTFISNGSLSDNGATLDLSGWLDGLLPWQKNLIIAAIVVASVIAAIILGCLVSKAIKAVRAAKQEAQYEKLTEMERKERIEIATKKLAMQSEATPLAPSDTSFKAF